MRHDKGDPPPPPPMRELQGPFGVETKRSKERTVEWAKERMEWMAKWEARK